MDTSGLGGAYHASNHYENFPVGSWLIPKPMRPAVLALYRFARIADDLADEGDMPQKDRMAALTAMANTLQAATGSGVGPDRGAPHLKAAHLQAPHLQAAHELALHLDRLGLDQAPALDLLKAFMADTQHMPMENEEDVLAYCANSANPVGRLMLGFAGLGNVKALMPLSDAICTGLQLTNFAQDLAQDLGRGRVYFPQSWWPSGWQPEMGAASLLPKDQNKIALQMAAWGQAQLNQGAGLPKLIGHQPVAHAFRFALEIGITLAGGREMCRMVKEKPAAVWQGSPQITKAKLPAIVFRGLIAILR